MVKNVVFDNYTPFHSKCQGFLGFFINYCNCYCDLCLKNIKIEAEKISVHSSGFIKLKSSIWRKDKQTKLSIFEISDNVLFGYLTFISFFKYALSFLDFLHFVCNICWFHPNIYYRTIYYKILFSFLNIEKACERIRWQKSCSSIMGVLVIIPASDFWLILWISDPAKGISSYAFA